MIPQGVIAALGAVQQAHRIGKRAKTALAGATPVGTAPSTVSAAATGVAGAVGAIAGGAATAAGMAATSGTKVNHEARQTAQYITDPMARARMPWWMRATIWLMVLLYIPWTLAQAVPGLKIFPGQWLSPTYGQVFGFGDVPGYMGLQDLWDRIKPAGTTPPPG